MNICVQYACVVKLDNITFLAPNRPAGVYSFPELCSQRSFYFSYIFSFAIMIIMIRWLYRSIQTVHHTLRVSEGLKLAAIDLYYGRKVCERKQTHMTQPAACNPKSQE